MSWSRMQLETMASESMEDSFGNTYYNVCGTWYKCSRGNDETSQQVNLQGITFEDQNGHYFRINADGNTEYFSLTEQKFTKMMQGLTSGMDQFNSIVERGLTYTVGDMKLSEEDNTISYLTDKLRFSFGNELTSNRNEDDFGFNERGFILRNLRDSINVQEKSNTFHLMGSPVGQYAGQFQLPLPPPPPLQLSLEQKKELDSQLRLLNEKLIIVDKDLDEIEFFMSNSNDDMSFLGFQLYNIEKYYKTRAWRMDQNKADNIDRYYWDFFNTWYGKIVCYGAASLHVISGIGLMSPTYPMLIDGPGSYLKHIYDRGSDSFYLPNCYKTDQELIADWINLGSVVVPTPTFQSIGTYGGEKFGRMIVWNSKKLPYSIDKFGCEIYRDSVCRTKIEMPYSFGDYVSHVASTSYSFKDVGPYSLGEDLLFSIPEAFVFAIKGIGETWYKITHPSEFPVEYKTVDPMNYIWAYPGMRDNPPIFQDSNKRRNSPQLSAEEFIKKYPFFQYGPVIGLPPSWHQFDEIDSKSYEFSLKSGSKTSGIMESTTGDFSLSLDNIISGTSGDDLIKGGKGLDVLKGGTSNDTYIYYKGDDGDVIKDIEGNDTLEIHGIPSSDITYEVSGDYGQNLIMKFATENEEDEDTQYIIIEDFFTKDGSYTTRSIENIILKNEGQADGTINVFDDIVTPFLSAAKLFNTKPDEIKNDKGTDDTFVGFRGNDIINGLRGNDTLDGGYGDDTLTGGEGDDMLYGGTGNDTYHYVYDQDGSDVISDRGYNVSGVDKLIISGINPAEADAIKLEVRGDNSEHLLITFKNDETLLITDYFKSSPTDDANENTCVEEIEFQGFNTTWTKTTILGKLAALNQNFSPSSDDEPVHGTRGDNNMQGGHGEGAMSDYVCFEECYCA